MFYTLRSHLHSPQFKWPSKVSLILSGSVRLSFNDYYHSATGAD